MRISLSLAPKRATDTIVKRMVRIALDNMPDAESVTPFSSIDDLMDALVEDVDPKDYLPKEVLEDEDVKAYFDYEGSPRTQEYEYLSERFNEVVSPYIKPIMKDAVKRLASAGRLNKKLLGQMVTALKKA
jgi:hypothetical protein